MSHYTKEHLSAALTWIEQNIEGGMAIVAGALSETYSIRPTRGHLEHAVKCARDGFGHVQRPGEETCDGCMGLNAADAFLAASPASPPVLPARPIKGFDCCACDHYHAPGAKRCPCGCTETNAASPPVLLDPAEACPDPACRKGWIETWRNGRRIDSQVCPACAGTAHPSTGGTK